MGEVESGEETEPEKAGTPESGETYRVSSVLYSRAF